MTCPKCGSENISFQVVNESKKIKHRLIFSDKVKSKNRDYAVCQSCGHH